MRNTIKLLFFCTVVLFFNACLEQNPNLNQSREDELKSLEVEHVLDQEQIRVNNAHKKTLISYKKY